MIPYSVKICVTFIIFGIVNALSNCIPQMIQAGVELFVALIENLPTIIAEIVKAVPQIIAGIVKAIVDSIPKLVESGKNLVQGIWKGISGAADWLWKKVKGWVGDLVGGIKDFLGIHSPSTVFAGIGENMGAGIGEGFSNAMTDVEKDMQNAIPTDFDVDTSIHGLIPGHNPSGKGLNLTIPLTLDGNTLAKVLAQIEWKQNAVYVRNLGIG